MSETLDEALASVGVDLEAIAINDAVHDTQMYVTLTLSYGDMCLVEWAMDNVLKEARKNLTKLQHENADVYSIAILEKRISVDKKILESIGNAFNEALLFSRTGGMN